MSEEWRAVPGYEGLYEASTLGRIRSLDRVVMKLNRWGKIAPHTVRGRVLTSGPHLGGYLTISLYRDGERWPTVVHIVIALTFLGPAAPGAEVMHLNGKPTDNAVSNLAYGTRLENEAAKEAHGTRLRGEGVGNSKLRVEDVLAIRARNGEPQANLAAEFNCTFSNISAIQLRKSWRHV